MSKRHLPMQPLGSSILPASGRPPSGLMPRLNQPSRLAALQARGLSCPAVRGNSGSFLYRDVPQAGRKATIQPRTCIQVSAVLIVFIAAMENVKWHPGFPAPRTGMPGTFLLFISGIIALMAGLFYNRLPPAPLIMSLNTGVGKASLLKWSRGQRTPVGRSLVTVNPSTDV